MTDVGKDAEEGEPSYTEIWLTYCFVGYSKFYINLYNNILP